VERVSYRNTILLSLLVAFSTVASANSYLVNFDNSDSGGGPVMIVGTGTFTFDGTYGDGTYYLPTLPNYQINFSIGSSTFTNADISTDVSHVQVVLYDGALQFYYDNDGTFGPHGGSLDFDKADGSFLTTEPNYFGAPPLNLYQVTDSAGNFYFGTYSALTGVPEPSYAGVLLALGAVAVWPALRRKKAA
jgi:hypothetical protein